MSSSKNVFRGEDKKMKVKSVTVRSESTGKTYKVTQDRPQPIRPIKIKRVA